MRWLLLRSGARMLLVATVLSTGLLCVAGCEDKRNQKTFTDEEQKKIDEQMQKAAQQGQKAGKK